MGIELFPARYSYLCHLCGLKFLLLLQSASSLTTVQCFRVPNPPHSTTPSDTMTLYSHRQKKRQSSGTQSCRSHRDLRLSKTSLPLLTWLSSSLGSGLVIWYDLGGLGPRGRLSAEKHLGCSKLAGKVPVLKRGCLPEEHNKGWSHCKAGN